VPNKEMAARIITTKLPSSLLIKEKAKAKEEKAKEKERKEKKAKAKEEKERKEKVKEIKREREKANKIAEDPWIETNTVSLFEEGPLQGTMI
jgi:hypothetical protein